MNPRRPAPPLAARRTAGLLATAGFVLLTACTAAEPQASPTPGLQGGVLATFDVTGETFKVWVTNPATIEQLLARQAGESTANIPNGRLLEGAGQGDHNTPWSWHLDPADIEKAETTIELCDGAPSYIEENLTAFIAEVGRYCPWSAQLTALEDLR